MEVPCTTFFKVHLDINCTGVNKDFDVSMWTMRKVVHEAFLYDDLPDSSMYHFFVSAPGHHARIIV